MLKSKGLCFAVILTAASGWLGTITSVPAIAAESASPRVVWQSLSPTERKLPRDVLVKELLAQGREVPSSWQPKTAAESRSRVSASDADAGSVYRITGDDLLSLHNIMVLVDIPVRTSSESRSYVVVTLTDAQVVEIAQYGAVQRIQRVKGPTAQGTTDAWTAHRFADMDGAGEPGNLPPEKPALTGSGVIIGVISLPATQAEVDDLVTDTSLPPLYDETSASDAATLYLYEGSETTAGLSAIDAAGVDAGLNMVQVIRDIAPETQVVFASPGTDSDPQDMANLIAALVLGRGSAGDANYIPPVDIIVDDLDYLTQNPFEVGLINEAIAAAKAAGTLYVTAAGDHGYHKGTGSYSNVYIDVFDGIAPPPEGGNALDPAFVNEVHQFSSNQYFLETEVVLKDLCLFWNEEPGVNAGDDYELITWNDINGDDSIDLGEYVIYPLDSPGECLQPASPIAASSRIIIASFATSQTDRFMLFGERADSSFIDSQGADDITATFSLTTPGAIRGHAYSSDALTVGGAPYFEDPADTVVPYWDTDPDDDANTDGGALAGTVSANAYSADGESSSQRLFWDKDDENNWQAVLSTDARAQPNKPDLIAASAIGVRTVNDLSVVVDETFHGTSASAGVVAATAALYWQFREWRISEESSQEEVAPEDILRAVQAAARGNTDQWSRILGYGVLDAPAPLESPLPPTELTLVEQSPGVLELSFERAFNDIGVDANFFYRVACTYPNNDVLFSDQFIEPADSGAAGTDKVPVSLYPANDRVGEEVACEVTAYTDGEGGWDGEGSASVTVSTSELSPPVVTMTAKSMGVALQFAASPDDSVASIAYDAVCTPDLPGWPGAVTPHTSESPSVYERLANPGTTINCAVTASLERASDPTLTLTAEAAGSATAGTPIATSLTVTPDEGGVSVRWIVDPNLALGASNAVTLKCTQGGAGNVLVDQAFTQASSYFVEADQSAPVQCSVTTAFSGTGVTTINQSAVSKSATADEESVGGLPIWLLYIVTQPE